MAFRKLNDGGADRTMTHAAAQAHAAALARVNADMRHTLERAAALQSALEETIARLQAGLAGESNHHAG